MSRNDSELRVKSFGGSAKNRYFSRLYNDWRNMFININKKNCFLIFFKMFLKHVKMGWQFQGTLKLSVYLIHFKIFFQELEAFQTSYLSIITFCNFLSIFSSFLFLLLLFQLTPLWIVIYLIWCQWLCFIINVYLHRDSHFQRKKIYTIRK